MNPLQTPDIIAFNGDADGITSAVQLLKKFPHAKPELVTGTKRDTALLEHVSKSRKKTIYGLDISVQKNIKWLKVILGQHCKVFWFDHHVSDTIPKSDNFFPTINYSRKVCTARLVDLALQEKEQLWALVGMYGDHLFEAADQIGQKRQLSGDQQKILKKMGVLINYNAHGKNIEDLKFAPKTVLETMNQYESPFLYHENEKHIAELEEVCTSDLKNAEQSKVLDQGIYVLDNKTWAYRVHGEFAHRLREKEPNLPHAVLIEKENSYLVSIRAPLNSNVEAGSLCKKFRGGGRATAGGIDDLPKAELEKFVQTFKDHFGESN